MIAPDILRKFAQGLEPNPGGDLSRSMIFMIVIFSHRFWLV